MLTAAGVADKNAVSMLAGLCKRHGDEAVADAIDRWRNSRPSACVVATRLRWRRP